MAAIFRWSALLAALAIVSLLLFSTPLAADKETPVWAYAPETISPNGECSSTSCPDIRAHLLAIVSQEFEHQGKLERLQVER